MLLKEQLETTNRENECLKQAIVTKDMDLSVAEEQQLSLKQACDKRVDTLMNMLDDLKKELSNSSKKSNELDDQKEEIKILKRRNEEKLSELADK